MCVFVIVALEIYTWWWW